MKNISKLLAIFSILFILPSVSYAKCDEVSITEMNWPSSQVITEIAKFLMENGYGCKVKKVPSATVTAITSLQETGKPDIATEIWSNATTIYHDTVKSGKVKTATNVFEEGGVEGWWIPEYLVEKNPELATIEGVLSNPELVGGVFHNCPTGWGCRIANDNYMEAFEFKKYGMKVFNHGSGETLAASIAAAFESKKPWFGYYWAPTAVLGKYPMVKVDVGPADVEIHQCMASKVCENKRKSGYPPSPVVTGVVTKFANENPEIFKLMSNISFKNDLLNSLLAWKDSNNATAEETAVKFITENKKMWKEWISPEARKKLSALL